VLAISAFAADAAFAGGFAVREQSAELQGMSFAGAAAGSMGLSSMFFNPATVTMHNGLNNESNIAFIITDSVMDDAGFAPGVPAPGLNNSGNIAHGNLIGEFATVPASYYNYQWNENIFLGLSINSPFGLETQAENAYAGTPHGVHSKVFNVIASPVVGYKINDMISVAVGPQISYINGKLTSSSNPAVFQEDISLKGDDWGFGVTAGVHVQIAEGTSVGVGYRSVVKHKLEGNFRSPFSGRVPASAKVDLPHTVTVSASHQVTDALKINASFEWADWSSLKALNISTPLAGFPPSTVFNWKDSFFYAIGAEYAFNEDLTVRAGFAYEDSPVPDSTRGPRVPDNDRYWLSAGASYQLRDWVTVHGSYTHIFVEDAPVSLTAPSPFFGTFETDINIVSLSATMYW
jgi:long-chain fatty acid transport protein